MRRNDDFSYLRVPEAGGAALQILHFDRFFRRLPTFARHVLDIAARHSRQCLLTGRRFLILVQSDDSGIRIGAVGRLSPWPNPRELFDWKPT